MTPASGDAKTPRPAFRKKALRDPVDSDMISLLPLVETHGSLHFSPAFCRNAQSRVYFVALGAVLDPQRTSARRPARASWRVWNPGLLTRLATKPGEKAG
jgi:hypothetical protein